MVALRSSCVWFSAKCLIKSSYFVVAKKKKKLARDMESTKMMRPDGRLLMLFGLFMFLTVTGNFIYIHDALV